jgi:hypothetical protein
LTAKNSRPSKASPGKRKKVFKSPTAKSAKKKPSQRLFLVFQSSTTRNPPPVFIIVLEFISWSEKKVKIITGNEGKRKTEKIFHQFHFSSNYCRSNSHSFIFSIATNGSRFHPSEKGETQPENRRSTQKTFSSSSSKWEKFK